MPSWTEKECHTLADAAQNGVQAAIKAVGRNEPSVRAKAWRMGVGLCPKGPSAWTEAEDAALLSCRTWAQARKALPHRARDRSIYYRAKSLGSALRRRPDQSPEFAQDARSLPPRLLALKWGISLSGAYRAIRRLGLKGAKGPAWLFR